MDSLALLEAAESHAMTLGLFDRVGRHEPKKAPGKGLHAAFWVQAIGPVRSSGLNSTTGRVELRVRLYVPMLTEPQDSIDPQIMAAVDALMTAYSGDFTLGGTVRSVDLLGAHGTPLSAVAGYLSQDQRLFRVMDIILPLIVNDLWSQAP